MPEQKIALTRELIGILEGKRYVDLQRDGDLLINLGMKNKVQLQLLRLLDPLDKLKEEQESAMKDVTRTVCSISKTLVGYDYAFFKLIKPISYVPADIDLLVKSDEAGKASRLIVKLGYSIRVKEPYCITLTRGSSIIDVYTYPTFAGVIYMDGQVLLESVMNADFNGVEITSLEGYAEALMSACHALYKEQVYTLNDFFTVDKWLSVRSFRLAEKLSCEKALKVAVRLNKLLREGIIDAPYVVGFPLWLMLMSSKFHDDRSTGATLPNALTTLFNRRIGAMVSSRLMRLMC